jgi:hypothetical protein
MDFRKTIRHLQGERAKIDAAILMLEELIATRDASPPPLRRRGRKSMGAAERQEVSERMRRYWEGRRTQTS